MEKNKLLLIGSEVPEEDTELNYLIKIIIKKFAISFFLTQTMFVTEKSLVKLKKRGIKIILLDNSLKEGLKNILRENYKVVLFDSHFIAKYYMPYVMKYSPDSILAIDMKKSQYLNTLKFLESSFKDDRKAMLLKQLEVNRNKEFALYNYADLLLLNSEINKDEIIKEIPNVPIGVVPKSLEKKTNEELIDLFIRVVKRRRKWNEYKAGIVVVKEEGIAIKSFENIVSKVKLDIKTVERKEENSKVESYNIGFKSLKNDCNFIMPSNMVLPPFSFEKLIFAMESHPKIGIVFPLSNLEFKLEFKGDFEQDFSGFFKKHSLAHFGNWEYVKQLKGSCFLIKREVIENVGLLDERFSTLTYALLDYSYRIFQEEYRMVQVKEVFVYYENLPEKDEKEIKKDGLLLIDKWGKVQDFENFK